MTTSTSKTRHLCEERLRAVHLFEERSIRPMSESRPLPQTTLPRHQHHPQPDPVARPSTRRNLVTRRQLRLQQQEVKTGKMLTRRLLPGASALLLLRNPPIVPPHAAGGTTAATTKMQTILAGSGAAVFARCVCATAPPTIEPSPPSRTLSYAFASYPRCAAARLFSQLLYLRS